MTIPCQTLCSRQARTVLLASGLILTTAADQVSTEQTAGDGAKGLITRQTSLGTTPLLSSFYFRFDHDDHPLKTIEVLPRAGGTLTDIAFADRDPTATDDEYNYQIVHQRISDPRIMTKSFHTDPQGQGVCFTHCDTIDPDLSSGQFIFVLRGFRFTYLDDDFAVKAFHIIEKQGNIDVELHDRSGRNRFSFEVDYALVPKDLISSSGSIPGQSRGPAQQNIPAGVVTLSGFSFEYVDDDFRVRELGSVVRSQPTNNIAVLFSDNSGVRQFNYRINYNIMNVAQAGRGAM